ncbi:uncharacterized protein LOC115876330 [Sitophilus oryzae]|uniref:Uncharacterized protein LOC115876330 n=1 Tax=Sitophilus oryzae TaxID=7048 RepID=A0A6J2XAD4_SITOR|nr:uncharacterized protein LOC115876330 [Sitophilus oryzae]
MYLRFVLIFKRSKMLLLVNIQFVNITMFWLFCLAKSKPLIQGRLSLAEPTNYYFRDANGPGTYAFGYDVDDPETDNLQFRDEERHANGTVTGKYGWVAPDGQVYMVKYISDNFGYRAKVETLPNFKKYKTRRFRTSFNNLF